MKTLPQKIVLQGFKSRSYRPEPNLGYFEQSAEFPIVHKSRVKIKDLKSGVFINARMQHYSENGVYVETNKLLLPGTVIYLGIEDSPFIPYANVYDVYRAEIVWLRLLDLMSYKYGYGIKIMQTRSTSK